MNRVVLSGVLIERGAMRYTPAGLPACNFSVQHESQVTEADTPRKVSLEMRAVGIGEIAQRLARLDIGASATFAGFLTHQRNGRGTVMHVTEFE